MKYREIKKGGVYKIRKFGVVTGIRILSKRTFKGELTGEKYYVVEYECVNHVFLGENKYRTFSKEGKFPFMPLSDIQPIW